MEEIEALATIRALEMARSMNMTGGGFDGLINDPRNAEFKSSMRRVQFDVMPHVADQLDAFCAGLEVSKREFLTAAAVDAMNRADHTYARVLSDRGVADRVRPSLFLDEGKEPSPC